MSCNQPMFAIPDGVTQNGKTKYKMIARYDSEILNLYPNAVKVPCGKCTGCRADKTREWADRMILELDHSKTAVFITLTYDDNHLPVFVDLSNGEYIPTLRKRDLQLFMKRLRKCELFRDRELRYYACGEYGSHTHRPHYHLILYGVSKEDFPDLSPRGNNDLGQQYFKSDFLADEIWKKGFCLISDVSWNTMAYVARYVKKKRIGLYEDNIKEENEFSVMSRRPGIGMYYIDEHDDVFNYTKRHIGTENGSIEVFLPKAFLSYLEKTDIDLYVNIKEQRRQAANNEEFTKLMQTDLSSMELDMIQDEKINKGRDIIDRYRTQV